MITKVSRYYYSLNELADVVGPNIGSGEPSSLPALLYKISPLWAVGSPTAIEQTMYQSYLWPEFYDAPVLAIDTECGLWEEPSEPTAAEIAVAVKPLLGRMHRWYVESLERYSTLISALEDVKSHLLGPVSTVTEGESSYSGSTTGSGTNTGTVEVHDQNASHGSTSVTNTRVENDVPQISTANPFADGYANKAAKETGSTVTTNAGETSSATTNNLSNTTTGTNSGASDEMVKVKADVETPIERFNEVLQKLRNLYADWANEFARFVIQSAE